MNIEEFSNILKSPRGIRSHQIEEIHNIVEEYPYFQAARALQLKIFQAQKNYRYNKALKVAAAHITDRTVLFNFIVRHSLVEYSNDRVEAAEVVSPQKENDSVEGKWMLSTEDSRRIANKVGPIPIPEWLYNINVNPEEVIESNVENSDNNLHPIKEDSSSELEKKLGIGKPLDFTPKEAHSFEEWLQVSRYEPIKREDNSENEHPIEENRKDKFSRIDKFLEANPKIEPSKDYVPTVNLAERERIANEKFMTETLAKVYLEQKKYEQAIEAYEILILKNPEKSGYFADRISAIKKIQQNN